MRTNTCRKKALTTGLFFLFLLLFCISCRKEKVTESRFVDSLLISKYDSLHLFPTQMRDAFRKIQRGLTDSASYYKLELFVSYCYYLQGEMDSSLYLNQEVMDFCNRHPENIALEASCWNHRYNSLQDIDQRDSSIACLHHAYNLLYRTEDRRELEGVCINLADAYRLKGNLPEASRYYRKALWVADSLQSKRVKFSIYLGLAQTYTDLHNFSLAHHYFDLADKVPDQRLAYEKYIFANSMGNCFYFEGKYAEALPCFLKAYQVVKSFSQPSINALVEMNLGETYTLLDKYDSAHYYLNKVDSFCKISPIASQEYIFYLNSLQAALALRENNLPKANYFLSKPYDPNQIPASYIYLHNKRLMEYYGQKKEYEKAYKYKLSVDAYDDSVRDFRSFSNIHESDLRYRQDTTLLKRDILIANDRAKISRQRTTLLLVFAILSVSVLLSILTFFHIRRKNERKYNQQVAMVAQLRMENIRNRISPHYVFNVLNAVMPTFKQYSDLAHPLQLLIEVLRGNLISSDKTAVRLEKEIELVKNYIELRKETNPFTANVVWNVGENVAMDTLIPSMIIQIPVENALKYAFDAMDRGMGQVIINITQDAAGLSLSIEDNGAGYHPGTYSESERSTGTGLKVLFRTIELLNKKNQQKAHFNIQNIESGPEEKHGTWVSIFIPFDYQFNF